MLSPETQTWRKLYPTVIFLMILSYSRGQLSPDHQTPASPLPVLPQPGHNELCGLVTEAGPEQDAAVGGQVGLAPRTPEHVHADLDLEHANS